MSLLVYFEIEVALWAWVHISKLKLPCKSANLLWELSCFVSVQKCLKIEVQSWRCNFSIFQDCSDSTPICTFRNTAVSISIHKHVLRLTRHLQFGKNLKVGVESWDCDFDAIWSARSRVELPSEPPQILLSLWRIKHMARIWPHKDANRQDCEHSCTCYKQRIVNCWFFFADRYSKSAKQTPTWLSASSDKHEKSLMWTPTAAPRPL